MRPATLRPMMTSAIVAAVALAILPAIPQRTEAKTGVLRCQMADGTSAYTNKACSTLGATSMPLPADTLTRISREQRRETKQVAIQSGMAVEGLSDLRSGNEAATSALPPARRPMASGCATTPRQLATDLQGSIALGDVNRIAESFDWAGMGNTEAQRIMARLTQIAKRPVRDSEYFDASIGSGVYADAGPDAGHVAANGTAGMLQVTFDAGNGASIIDFNVRRDKGCYFLRF